LGLGGAKQHAIVAMFLDWLYNIVTLVIIHSPSLANGLESMNAKRLRLESLGLREIEVNNKCFRVKYRYTIYHTLASL
jgi:hypothetical protein